MQERNYAKRSWAMLTRDRGWFKPVLVLAAANFVPIVGFLGAAGYALEWARLTAWGVDSSPKQKNVQVGVCIASGWRAFVVAIGWALCLVLAAGVAGFIAGVVPGVLGSIVAMVVTLASLVVEFLAATVIAIASVRAAIYEKVGAGFRVDRVFEMIKRDVQGFFHLTLIAFVFLIALGLVTFVLVLIPLFAMVPAIITSGYASSEYAVMMELSKTIGGLITFGLVLGYAVTVVLSAYNLVYYNAIALWMRQFDVPSWGRSEDPLPQTEDGASMTDVPQQPASTTAPAAGQQVVGDQPRQAPYSEPIQSVSVRGSAPEVESMPATERIDPVPTIRYASEAEPVEPMAEPELTVEPQTAIDTPVIDGLSTDLSANESQQQVMSDVDETFEEGGVDDLYSQLYDVMHRDD